MSRENRMLVMFAVGMMLLFTYFRVHYPNMGEVEGPRPAQEAPLLQVACAPDLRATIEKIVRSYELEFGVRVLLDSGEQESEKLAEPDLVIDLGDPQGTATAENVVHWFSHELVPGDQRGKSIRIGLIDNDENRRKGSARLARYILALDRGLPILIGEVDDQADLWDVDPEVNLVVWHGLYGQYREKLENFQRMEGVFLRIVVADCSLLASKMTNADEVDALVYPNLECLEGLEQAGWQRTGGTEIELMLVSQSGDVGEARPISQELSPFSLVAPAGFSDLLDDQSLEAILGREPSQSMVEYSRISEMLAAIQSNPNVCGIMFREKALELENVENLRTQQVLNPVGSVRVSLYTSEGSRSKRLVGRLGQFLSWD